MQKKIIALAIAGLASTAAFAQSNVTIYGIADAYVGRVDAGDTKKTTTLVNSGGLSGSRLGFKGAEDLGNGLKAIFNAEYALAIDDNTGIGNARQEYVGLTGGFGTAVAGYLQTTGYDWGVKFGGALAGSALSPLQNLTTNAGLIGATNATAARLGNAVAYISPSFGGFTAAVNYTAGATATESVASPNANNTAWMASGTYANGPVAAGLVYAKLNAVAVNSDRTDWALGASYDFGVAKLSATYQTTQLDAATSPADNRDKVYSVSASVPVSTAGAVHVSYAKNNIASSAIDNTFGYSVAYTHGLSKRTTAYAGYSKMNNGSTAALSVANNAAGFAPVAGQDPSVLVAGVRHSF